MNPKNEWLDGQIKSLNAESHKKKNGETWMLIKFLCLLLPLLFYAVSLHSTTKTSIFLKHPYVKQTDGGVHFTCKRCRMVQWQDKKNANWRGEYFCRNCGCRMGDE